MGSELYRWTGQREDPMQTLAGWRRVLPADAVFTGPTAAWLLGLDLQPTDPVHVAVPLSAGLRPRSGLNVLRCEIPPEEVAIARGYRVTSLPRSLIELCLRRSEVEALVAIDMAICKRLTDSKALTQYAKQRRPGAARLRSLAPLAAPAESPMETRLRWLLIKGGLPRPEVQTKLLNVAARADLYYPQAHLVVEYDGGNHRERLVEDDQRQNLLVNAGYQVLRFTAVDIYKTPEVTVAQVRENLRRRV
jgi:very-short-patch-repair endonuclease